MSQPRIKQITLEPLNKEWCSLLNTAIGLFFIFKEEMKNDK